MNLVFGDAVVAINEVLGIGIKGKVDGPTLYVVWAKLDEEGCEMSVVMPAPTSSTQTAS